MASGGQKLDPDMKEAIAMMQQMKLFLKSDRSKKLSEKKKLVFEFGGVAGNRTRDLGSLCEQSPRQS